MANLAGYAGAFYLSSDAGVNVSTETVNSDAGSGGLTYTTANKWIDPSTVVITGVSLEQDFTVNPNGTLTFTTSQGASVTADYTYYPNTYPAGGFTGWSIDVTADALDSTNFTSTGWRTFVAGLKGWSGSAEKHWTTDLTGRLSQNAILRFYTDETNSDYYTGWGLITGLGTTEAVDALVENSLSFSGRHGIFLGE